MIWRERGAPGCGDGDWEGAGEKEVDAKTGLRRHAGNIDGFGRDGSGRVLLPSWWIKPFHREW